MSSETAARPLTGSLLLLFNAIARGAPEGSTLELHARSPQGLGYQCLRPPIPREAWAHLPPVALKLLEDGWGARVGAAVRDRTGSQLASLGVLFSIHPIAVDFGRETEWRHQAAAADVDAVLARLDSFPLPPTFIIDGVSELVAIWALTEPITDLDRARRLQRRLAETLGASTASVGIDVPSATMGGGHRIEYPADDPASHVPFPGSIVRNVGDPAPVAVFAAVAPEHVCTVEEMEATLWPGGEPR